MFLYLNIAMVTKLLAYGANPDILDPDGQMVHDKKDLAAFIQWKVAILPVEKDISKDEYIKSLLELI
ncbi:hypothetical protein FLA4_06940 [Candidatus Rickettsia kotlanii]|nr:hypothetical protein FLA4_06940 [Candidatus Rickettsia kotlanii]BDU61527.1 hypothetical protein HM2_06950 [Candidatus Rickettsia kotlanii]